MGQRGPKPGQYKVKMLPAGSPAAKSGGRTRFAPGAPACPPWLSAAAKRVYKRVVAELDAAGAVATVDTELLAAYCTASADLATVSAAIDKAGVVVEVPTVDRNGRKTGHTVQKANPLLRTKDALLGRVKQLAETLGIGHAARVRQGGTAADEQSKPANRVIALREQIAAIRRGDNPPSTGNRVLDIAARHQAAQ